MFSFCRYPRTFFPSRSSVYETGVKVLGMKKQTQERIRGGKVKGWLENDYREMCEESGQTVKVKGWRNRLTLGPKSKTHVGYFWYLHSINHLPLFLLSPCIYIRNSYTNCNSRKTNILPSTDYCSVHQIRIFSSPTSWEILLTIWFCLSNQSFTMWTNRQLVGEHLSGKTKQKERKQKDRHENMQKIHRASWCCTAVTVPILIKIFLQSLDTFFFFSPPFLCLAVSSLCSIALYTNRPVMCPACIPAFMHNYGLLTV